jgi:hypothetical protein
VQDRAHRQLALPELEGDLPPRELDHVGQEHHLALLLAQPVEGRLDAAISSASAARWLGDEKRPYTATNPDSAAPEPRSAGSPSRLAARARVSGARRPCARRS